MNIKLMVYGVIYLILALLHYEQWLCTFPLEDEFVLIICIIILPKILRNCCIIDVDIWDIVQKRRGLHAISMLCA
jgi:uncharacterized membrane protein YccF (DUF307 family)